MNSMLERHHLMILQAIDREGSLTAAAKALHLTQSALSHAIKKLEQQIGTSLWIKDGRQLRFTQAGEYLLKEAKRLLPQLEHADTVLSHYAQGDRGLLRIGMECHPCYQWLLTIVSPFLQQWPKVDVDVKQKFQFGGMAALLNYDIDILITPDPLEHKSIVFTPVFDYEQVLVVNTQHPLAQKPFITPDELSKQTLYTYPVATERLDIYTQFLLPAQCMPKQHKTIEATEMMLQLVAANRGVTTLPLWLVNEFNQDLAITSVRLGKHGIHKRIHLGMRSADHQATLSYAQAFLDTAQGH